jgi:putative PIN family toxin of toxin-antitoxin system
MYGPRIVLDTNVLVSALRSRRGASHKLLLLIDSAKFATVLSVAVFLEYEEAVKRMAGQITLSDVEVDDILDYVCEQAEHVTVSYTWRPMLSDPDDDMLLELAVAGHCDYIVTYNRRDFKGADAFGIQLRTPKELLQEIGEFP